MVPVGIAKIDSMKEKRATPRKRTFKTGTILVGGNAPNIACRVRNLSLDGACLDLSATYGVPARFDLICDGKHYTCRVVWLNESQVGVMFV